MSNFNKKDDPGKSAESVEKLDEKELQRRKFLKRATLGAGVAATSPVWLRPVVNTVILPAHAQASTTTTLPPPA